MRNFMVLLILLLIVQTLGLSLFNHRIYLLDNFIRRNLNTKLHPQIDQARSISDPDVSLIRDVSFKRVCYFRMDPKTEIHLNQVDVNLCTHIILGFARIDSSGDLILFRDDDLSYLLEIPQLKSRHPSLKVMISIANDIEYDGFPKVASNLEARQRFARSTLDFLKRYNLDGIDLDWEFPNFPTAMKSREHERVGLTKIVKSLRSIFVENFFNRQVEQQHKIQSMSMNHHLATANPVEPYILTVAIAGQEAVLRASYELKQIANLCDWLNVMSYDYFLFKPYAPFTGHNSPLNSIFFQYVPIISKLSHSWTLSKLLEEEIPKEKIVMGIPTYARAYRLVFKQSYPALFSLSLGEKGGRIDDYLDYREVCDIIRRPDTIVDYDQKARVPHLLTDNGYTWVSYENPQSVREKVHHILENDLAGYMTWNLNSDDFTGLSSSGHEQPVGHQVTFPLHRAMLDEVVRFLINHKSKDH